MDIAIAVCPYIGVGTINVYTVKLYRKSSSLTSNSDMIWYDEIIDTILILRYNMGNIREI